MMGFKSDMSFFFNEAMPHLGFSSSYSSFKFRMEGGRPVPSTEPLINDGIIKHIRKYNRIRSLLQYGFTSQERARLNGLFNRELLFPPIIKATFGEHAGLAVFHPQLPELLYVVEYKTSTQLCMKRNADIVNTIKRDCKDMYQQLQDKYQQEYQYASRHQSIKRFRSS